MTKLAISVIGAILFSVIALIIVIVDPWSEKA